MAEDKKLTQEILRLLMQVSWADGVLDEAEVDAVVEFARQGGFDDEEAEAIKTTLRGGKPLPAPDFGFLRNHREAALAAAKKIVAADGVVDEDEVEMLAEIEALLGS